MGAGYGAEKVYHYVIGTSEGRKVLPLDGAPFDLASNEGMLPIGAKGVKGAARVTLAGLNDQQFTFDQIADLIEAFWPWI